MADWTIQKLLNWVTQYLADKGIESPRLCAELLLGHVLNLKRIELYTQFDKVVTQHQLDQLRQMVKRAAQNEPVQYLVGKTEFYSLELEVTPDCLIPRPETELLVERAIEFLRPRPGPQTVCDLCTGSGCIAIAIARNVTNCRVVATDVSDAALAVAARNISRHGLEDRVELLCGDLFDPIVPGLDKSRFDLITCNPPYIASGEFETLERKVKNHEPREALLGGEDGLDTYRRIAEKVDQFLESDGALMLEIGYRQGQAVREILEQAECFTQITIEKDANDNDRVVIAHKDGRNNG